jgi:hypothetical protein
MSTVLKNSISWISSRIFTAGFLTGTHAAAALLYEVETTIDGTASIAGMNHSGRGGCKLRAFLCPPSHRLMRSKTAQVSTALYLSTLQLTSPSLNRSRMQLVFVNGRPCARGPVHKLLSRAYKMAAASLDGSKQDEADCSLPGLRMPQRKKRQRDEQGLSDPSGATASGGHPMFLVMISCPVGDCSFSTSSDAGSDIVPILKNKMAMKMLHACSYKCRD